MSELVASSKIGELVRHGFSPTGLRLQPGMSYEEWVKVGAQVSGFQNASSWALGDWFFYGEWEYGSRYEAAAAATGLTYQALADLKYVAGRYEFSRRRETLSLSHHRELAPLALEEQDRWLDLAEKGKWSREQLRQALAGNLPFSDEIEDRVVVLPAARQKAAIASGVTQETENAADMLLEERLELLDELVGTGICRRCETCLGCGCAAGPIENHDLDCSVREL